MTLQSRELWSLGGRNSPGLQHLQAAVDQSHKKIWPTSLKQADVETLKPYSCLSVWQMLEVPSSIVMVELHLIWPSNLNPAHKCFPGTISIVLCLGKMIKTVFRFVFFKKWSCCLWFAVGGISLHQNWWKQKTEDAVGLGVFISHEQHLSINHNIANNRTQKEECVADGPG